MVDAKSFSASLQLDEPRLQLLLRALDTYVGHVFLRAQGARETGGRMRTHLNEGIPPNGLDSDRLFQLYRDADQLVDVLLELIPADCQMTIVYEDGTPVLTTPHGSGDGPSVSVPASIGFHLTTTAAVSPARAE